MIEYAGLNGRNQLVNDLADKFETQTASSVTLYMPDADKVIIHCKSYYKKIRS